jgi:N-acetyl-gamma-glutamyl-phosphate reductase
MNRRRIGILGATTPNGVELMRVLAIHPMAELAFAADELAAGELIHDRFPGLAHSVRGAFVAPEEALGGAGADADVVISALPLREAEAFLPHLLKAKPGVKLVDLSPLFRPLPNDHYHRLYGERHPLPGAVATFEYGITAHNLAAIGKAGRVSVPGPLAAGLIVALEPLAAHDLLRGTVTVSAVCGRDALASGGSRARAQAAIEAEGFDAVAAVNPLIVPQADEAAVWLARGAGPGEAPFELACVPVAVPMARCVYLTVFVPVGENLAHGSLDALIRAHHGDGLFTRLLARPPALADVAGTNRLHLSYRASGNVLVATVALDALGRGGAHQAIACANLMLGLPEEAGLLFPAAWA